MRLAYTTESGEVHNLEVDSQMELENFKALIETETGIAPADQVLYYHEQELTDPKKTLEQYGVIQDDILFLKRRPLSSAEDIRHTILSRPELMQQLLENQPELAAAVNDPSRFTALIQRMEEQRQRMQNIQNVLNSDPFDVETQRRIEEEIRVQNVQENMDIAMEHNPETFGKVTMLYINVEVDKHPLKAFVDSGAQETIMSAQCAENCGIMRLVDRRFSGIAKGVGTAKIVGRVHSCIVRVGKDLYLPCSFTIIEGSGVDLLFGLDMLKRHQACIDLRKNALVINDKEVPFLAEHEIPKNEEILGENLLRDIASSSSASNKESSSISTSNTHNQSSVSSVPQQPQQQSRYPEEHIQSLISMCGITRDEAIQYLDLANGDVETAANFLLNG